MRPRPASAPLLVLLIAALAACGSPAAAGSGTTAASIDVPEQIGDDDFAEYERVYWSLPLDDPARTRLRERLVTYLGRRTRAIIDADDYEAAVGQFSRISELYTPEDFGGERIPEALEPLARYLRERGSPRGDESRVLSALLVLRALDDHDRWDAEYRELAEWGRDARATLPSPIERYSRLIDVWQEHSRLTPSPEVLDLLARMHVERRDAILGMLPGEDGAAGLARAGISPEDLRNAPILVRRAPLDVAGVYLQHGDLASALSNVEAMGDANGIENELIRTLRDARAGDDDALIELAREYSEGRPDVTLGICRLGRRRSPGNPQFPLCLARVAAGAGEFPRATGWYADAIRLAPEERDTYDEALTRLAEFIARGLFDADPSEARGMARAAERILEQYEERWPDSEPALSRQSLHFVIGQLEMNAGNTGEARERFEASLAAKETADAHLALGRIAESTGRPEDAARHYRRALDMTLGDGPQGTLARARIMEHLGDAFRASGDTTQADRMYRQALGLWDTVLETIQGEALAEAQLNRGILLDRLGRRDEAVVAFRQAMEAAPARREIYAQILSHLVVSEPAPELAREVFTTAQRQLTLEPEWKVYFALWLEAIAARAGESPSAEAREVLETHSTGTAWWGRLARFGTGALPYEELLAEASNRGERTEAHFYEGARLLRAGDEAGAERLFRRVLETRMVNFYEFIMALELLEQDRQRAAEATAAQPSDHATP